MKGLFLVSKHIPILDSARTVAVYTATVASLLAVYAVPAIYFFPTASSETTFCTALFSRVGTAFFTVSLSALFFIGAYCCAATLHIHNFTYFFQKKGVRIALPTLVAFVFLVPLLTVLAHLSNVDKSLFLFSPAVIYRMYAPGPYTFLGVFLFLLLLSALLKKLSPAFFRHRYDISFQKVFLAATLSHVVITLILIYGINTLPGTVETLSPLIGWIVYYGAGIQAYRARIFANNTCKPAFTWIIPFIIFLSLSLTDFAGVYTPVFLTLAAGTGIPTFLYVGSLFSVSCGTKRILAQRAYGISYTAYIIALTVRSLLTPFAFPLWLSMGLSLFATIAYLRFLDEHLLSRIPSFKDP